MPDYLIKWKVGGFPEQNVRASGKTLCDAVQSLFPTQLRSNKRSGRVVTTIQLEDVHYIHSKLAPPLPKLNYWERAILERFQ